jgi:YVTN family beta-propeller protein
VTHWYGYDVAILEINDDRLRVADRVEVGPEPRGVVISPDGRTAYLALGVTNEIVRLDLESRNLTGRVTVGREPRNLVIDREGSTLIVSNARCKFLSVIDVAAWKVTRELPIEGVNQRQVVLSPDGKTAYVANMFNRGFATTKNNIDLGWVLGQRLTRVDVDGSEPYQTLSLDVKGKAAADVHGAAISQDGKYLAVSCGGSHEVMIFRTDLRRLPWRPNGSRDVIAAELLKDDGRFRRVTLGGRPTEITFGPDGRTLYVANYLNNSIQVVDVESASLQRTILLGGPEHPSLARKGEALFHDAGRSFNQWYSCNTCHSDGHTNGLDFDTLNDGWQDMSVLHQHSRKKVPTLRRVLYTKPWTWHGWQTSLENATVESFTKSMQGEKPTSEEAEAVVAFLASLDFPRNPNRGADDSITEQAQRGREVFRSPKAACASCHSGPEFTDGKIHTTGLEEPRDVYRGYNPPSLRGVYDKDPYLHDGRAKTLKDALQGAHNPEEVTGLGSLTDTELDDLIAYLQTL